MKKPPVNKVVLDASAMLAYINNERGAQAVHDVLARSVVSTVNLVEAFSKLVREGMDVNDTRTVLQKCFPEAVPVDRDQAETAAIIHAANAKMNVSYADSLCLALGACRDVPILTCDQKWKKLELGFDVDIRLIR